MTDATRRPTQPVMIVDDDIDIRFAIELALESSGYRVVGAANGLEALRDLRTRTPLPFVILLDLRMPGMNGEEFRAAQLLDPAIASVPVVVLSGDTQLDRRALGMGGVRAMRKPVDFDELLAEVAFHTDRATAR